MRVAVVLVAVVLIDINLAIEVSMAGVTNKLSDTRESIVDRNRRVRAEAVPAERLEQAVRMLLEQHPHFSGRCQFLRVEVSDRVLRLAGYLPSFFLKQLAQEAVRDLDGIDEIENHIIVGSPVEENRDVALPESPPADKLPQNKKPR